MARHQRKRNIFPLHIGSSEIDHEIDKWLDRCRRKGVNASGYIKELLYKDITGLDPYTGLPVRPVITAVAEAEPERPRTKINDPRALRLGGIGD